MSEFNGQLGVVKTEKGYQFSVWAPHAKSVSLVGDFNDWQGDADVMKAEDNGVWRIEKEDASNGSEYKFEIETQSGDKLLKNDPRARLMTNSVGNSVIYDDDFDWNNDDFNLMPAHERVIYELHIGTFNRKADQQGSFESAIERLPELVELGINIVELMPVNEFAGDISWGYNPAYPFAVEEAYGGPDGLKKFIDAAHELGIGVIIDVVYNHFGPSDLDLWQFDGWSENGKGGIYFYNDDRSGTPWGDSRPDYGRAEVRDYIRDNALMWLTEFRADGLRMDMVPFMRSVSGSDNGQDDLPEAYQLIKEINHIIAKDFPNKMSIAEDLHRHDFITNKVHDDGCGYTAQWDAEFVHPIRRELTQSNDEHVDLDAICNALCHVYSNDPYSRIIYTESHDEVANGQARLVEEVAPGNVDDDYFAKQKGMIAAVLVLTGAGIPMLFQGQALKESGWFDDTKELSWDRKERFKRYYSGFQTLISLRKNSDGQSAGLTGGGTEIIHKDDHNKVIGYRRFNQEFDQSTYVFINLSNSEIEDYTFQGLADNAKCLFAWSDGLLDASSYNHTDSSITLPAYGALIYS